MKELVFIWFLVSVSFLFFSQYPGSNFKFNLNFMVGDLVYTERLLFCLNWVVISLYLMNFFLFE